MDFGSVYSVLEKVRPDVIFHLAAFANVRSSFVTPNLFLSNNILSTSNLFEAIRLTHQDPIIQLCSTSECGAPVYRTRVEAIRNFLAGFT